MRKLLLKTLLLLFTSALAEGQIMAVHFKDEKAAKKYKDHLSLIDGEWVVVGEAKFGVAYKPEARNIEYQRTGRNEFFVCDPDDPGFLPYKLQGEEKVASDKRGVLTIQGQHIRNISILIQQQSLYGLAQEYKERQGVIVDLVAQRDQCGKGSREWGEAHQRLLSHYERLISWMTSTVFPTAANKVAKEYERQKKVVAAEAAAARIATAKASVHMVETPQDLIAASQAITGGKCTFHVQESQHVRIVYRADVGDERVKGLLEFVEVGIDGFRGDCVDPYVDDVFEDKIPERLFQEFFFGPEDMESYDRFFTEYYHQQWGDRKKEQMEVAGQTVRRSFRPERLNYRRVYEGADLEGVVAHVLGHTLADIHYNSNQPGMAQDWIEEGVGYYISLEFFGRNTVTCKAFAEPGKYVHQKKKEGEKSLLLGLRDFYNSLALDTGPPLDKLAMKTLAEMVDADLAKCWSFYDFLVRKEGRQGQLFLRAACEKARNKATFMKAWRDKSEEIYDVEGQDIFKLIDARWREFAETGQDTGDSARAK